MSLEALKVILRSIYQVSLSKNVFTKFKNRFQTFLKQSQIDPSYDRIIKPRFLFRCTSYYLCPFFSFCVLQGFIILLFFGQKQGFHSLFHFQFLCLTRFSSFFSLWPKKGHSLSLCQFLCFTRFSFIFIFVPSFFMFISKY